MLPYPQILYLWARGIRLVPDYSYTSHLKGLSLELFLIVDDIGIYH